MTPITYCEIVVPPLEMWVEGRTARDYPDFDVVDYKSPPPGLIGCFSGRAKIRKQGGTTTHRYSPELVALHTAVRTAIENNEPNMFGSGLRGRRLKASKDFSEGHHRLYSGDLDFHGTLIQPCEGEYLDDVQGRIVDALRTLSAESTSKGGQVAWTAVADAVEGWSYNGLVQP